MCFLIFAENFCFTKIKKWIETDCFYLTNDLSNPKDFVYLLSGVAFYTKIYENQYLRLN